MVAVNQLNIHTIRHDKLSALGDVHARGEQQTKPDRCVVEHPPCTMLGVNWPLTVGVLLSHNLWIGIVVFAT